MTDYSTFKPIVYSLNTFPQLVPPQGQSNYGDMPSGYPGMVDGMGTCKADPGINSTGAQPETWTIAVPATVDSEYLLCITIPDVAKVNLLVAGTTQAEVTTALLKVLNEDPDACGAFNISESANTITLEAKDIYAKYDVADATPPAPANPLTITKTVETVTDLDQMIIGFGLFVVSYPGYADSRTRIRQVSLPTAAANPVLVGASLLDHSQEKYGRGPHLKEGYQFGQVLSIVYDVFGCRQMWVDTVEDDLTYADTALYADAANGTGKLTRVSAGNLLIPNARVVTPTEKTYGDRNVTGIFFRI